jgi:hypothetical protein
MVPTRYHLALTHIMSFNKVLLSRQTKGPPAPGGVGPGPARVEAYPDPPHRVGGARTGNMRVPGQRPHRAALGPGTTIFIHNFFVFIDHFSVGPPRRSGMLHRALGRFSSLACFAHTRPEAGD